MAKSPRKENSETGQKKDLIKSSGGVGDHILIYQGETKHLESTSSLESHIEWMKQNSGAIILIVLPILLVAVILGWIVVPCFIRAQISNKVIISPEANPELYSAWIHPPVPVYLKIYLFNVTNPEMVKKGALPSLQELGPYVFRENRTKVEIAHHDASDTVTYKEHISYHFEQEMSGEASLQDVVTIINVPFAAAAIKISELPWPIGDLALTMLLSFKEKLFIQRTVDEALFKGWKVNFLERIEKEMNFNLIPNNTFGFFIGQNDTAQGPYTVSRGTQDKSSFGAIVKFKNETELEFWGDRTTSCNQLRGTDGTIFHPFVTKSTVLRLFNAELCRSLYLTYQEDTDFEGIKGYLFVAPPSLLEAPAVSDENRCYCAGVDQYPEKCLRQGTLDLGPCREGAPVAMSTPHFLDADPEYIDLSGLTPDRAKHETFMKIEPTTGVILDASKKIQINLILSRVKGVSELSKVPNMLFPLVWADECASLDPENMEKFKSALFQLWLVDFISKWIVLGIALGTCVFFITRRLRSQTFIDRMRSKNDNEGCDPSNTNCSRAVGEDESEVENDFESKSSQHIPLQQSH